MPFAGLYIHRHDIEPFHQWFYINPVFSLVLWPFYEEKHEKTNPIYT